MNDIPHIRKSHYVTGELREAFTSTGETCAQALIQNQEYLDIPKGGNHVESPCHLAKLPKELRLEIWKYVLQQRDRKEHVFDLVRGYIHTELYQFTKYPMHLSELFLSFNRETYEEIKDVFYNITTFVIYVDGTGARFCK